jgi:two-component system nitrate/nitrite response regulator NarL
VQILANEPDIEIVASALNGDEALAAVRQFRPDILVLDLRMPGKDGVAVLREMKREGLGTRVVVLTAENGEDAVEAVRLGARGIVLKDMAPRLLIQCIREVHAGRQWLEKSIAARTVTSLLKREAGTRSAAAGLTRRELQVARLVADGFPSKAIAKKLAIAEGTAKLHLHHVYAKLKVDGRMALARYLQTGQNG